MATYRIVLHVGMGAALLVTCIVPQGCRSSNDTALAATVGGAEISGPLTMNKLFGTRDPRQCVPVKHKPNEVEAAALIQCAQESQSHDYMTLYNNVRVSMAGSRVYQYNADSGNSDIDTTAPVYPIRGAMDQYVCHQAGQVAPDQSCLITHMGKASGSCVKTTFGDWHCSMLDLNSPPGTNGPAPTTY